MQPTKALTQAVCPMRPYIPIPIARSPVTGQPSRVARLPHTAQERHRGRFVETLGRGA